MPLRILLIAVLFLYSFIAQAKADTSSVRVGPSTFDPESTAGRAYHLPLSRFQPGISALPNLTYKPKYSTIAHTILSREVPLGTVTDDMYRLVDSLIDQAKAKLAIIPNSGDPRQDAALRLKAIDDLLIDNSFVYPGVGLIQLLSDGMTPQKMNATQLQQLLSQPHNYRRRDHINAHASDAFYLVDCDTASFLYLGIGQELKLPLFLVEVPEHNFIRWYFNDTDYLNWETMDGIVRSDDFYKVGYAIPADLIQKGVFLSKMTPDDVLGYCHFVVGGAWEQKKECAEAIKQYELATMGYSRVPGGWNNLAWILVTCRDAAHRDGKRAVANALKAVSIYRNANNLDTLGCAYAEAGDFAKAIEVETEAFTLSGNSEYRDTIEGFRQGKTWIQQHPSTFRQNFIMNANR